MLEDIQRVFITGGAGFIGSHLTDELVKQGHYVTVFDNLSSGKKQFLKKNFGKKNFQLVIGDLTQKEHIRKALKSQIDIIFHLAANTDISKGVGDPTLDFNQTIIATFNLLIEMKKKKIRKIIYFSGSGVYGDVGNTYTHENFGPLLPISMYGASKLSGEALICAFSHLYDMKAWIFRPANIVGDRITHGVVFDFIKRLKKNPHELIILGDGNQSKSYLYIRDVLDAVWIALKNTNKQINIFNITSKSFVTVNEIAEITIQQLRLKSVRIIHTGGKIGWPGDVPIVRIENKKLHDLGWQPKYNSLDAIKKTIQALSKSDYI